MTGRTGGTDAETPATAARPFWSRALAAVLAAQFLSALADNGILFGALALLKLEHYPDWTQPVLQEFFVAAYIVLAPFAGPFADSRSKGTVMLISNGIKFAGALGVCVGLNPFLMYGLIGLGAAAYSPAKYGILSEITSPDQLVKANSWIESSTIAAILIGAITGGILADWNVGGALAVFAGCYAAAAAANLLIPYLPPARPLDRFLPGPMVGTFAVATRTLLANREARFSILGTSSFWGAGAALRFLLVAWVPIALGITSIRMPAYLNAVVAVGIVIGAALAGRFVSLRTIQRAMPAGILLGASVCLLAGIDHLAPAFALMVLVGACGGFFVVPLNALLQERGHSTVGAGNAVAVQNLAENSIMLAVLGLYTLANHAGMPIRAIAIAFGGALALCIAALWATRRRPAETHVAT